ALFAGRLVPRLGEWPVVLAGLTSGAVGAMLVALNGSDAHLALLLLSTVPVGFTPPAPTASPSRSPPYATRERMTRSVARSRVDTFLGRRPPVTRRTIIKGAQHVHDHDRRCSGA